MSESNEQLDTPEPDESVATIENEAVDSPEKTEIGTPEFQELKETDNANEPTELARFQEIKVTVSADLGRAIIPIQTLLNLGEGSILELDRQIDSPVELVAQGVPLACGEVVVVDGCFAVRVTKVYDNEKPQSSTAKPPA